MGQKPGKHSGIPKSPSSSSGNYGNNGSSDENDGPSREVNPVRQKKRSKQKKMPLFRKQSEQARRRCEHQQYLAQEDPEPTFDLSNCELEEVPSGVFPLCKVLQKEVLLLNDNWLRSLPERVSVLELITIRVLDLHNNELRSLPDEIGQLTSLQVLNLENNKIRKLPSTLGQLVCLQTLNVNGNKLKALPDSICTMKCLRMLDISHNFVTVLPKNLCQVRTMETLTLDTGSMEYPPSDVCSGGTEETMKFLCSECGMEYLPPSNFLLDILEPPKPSVTSPNIESFNKTFQLEEDLVKTVKGYNEVMDKKRQELMEVERVFEEQQQQQAELALLAASNRDKMISLIAKEENDMELELETLSNVKERDRQKLIQEMKEIEDSTEALITQMLDMDAKAKKAEAFLEDLEQERIEEDERFVVRWEEEQNLRKKDVLAAMKNLVQESEIFELVRQTFTNTKDSQLQRAMEDDEMMASAQVESILFHKDIEQSELYDILAKQEKLQKEAFEALQLQKDLKHQRIMKQIAIIQDELASLTVIEMDRRQFKMEEEMNRLAEKRIALIELLTTLSIERDRRQVELRKRLAEMEEQRQDGQVDYWLVQYQRLMDQKPQSLIDREHQLEISVVKILEKSNARDYIPLFARNRISIETLLQMTEDDLKQMGVHEMGLRKNIMSNLEIHRVEAVVSKPSTSAQPDEQEGASALPTPSAPPLEASPTRQTSIHARGINSECVVCMDNRSDVIFLNCGHVCCCVGCSGLLHECPLCRSEIVNRIKLIPTGIVDS